MVRHPSKLERGFIMDSIFEMTIIGRGGQGAKTASEVLANTALKLGKHIQAFSEYGAERAGAPITSYVRISDTPITIHIPIEKPDLIVLMDDTLIDMVIPNEGCSIIVNSGHSAADLHAYLNYRNCKVYAIDCTSISIQVLGLNIPNTPMVGTITKITKIVPIEAVETELRQKLEKKLGREMMDKNITCMYRGYNEIKEG
jgi:pyruvate ferredoxin oxidoreductase gamma subunit